MEISKTKKFKRVDEYISTFPENIQLILEKIRKIIQEAAPKAEELISYNMPAYKLNGMLVFFAANKKHIGFYPTNEPIEIFKEELTSFKTSKGAIQFPLEKPLPVGLIKKIVKYKMKANLEKAYNKKAKN